MEILQSIVVGALVGGLACLVLRVNKSTTAATLAVGVLGSLLGLSADKWLGASGTGTFAMSEYVATGAGALMALILWGVAQRLFLSNPKPVTRE